MGTQYYCKNERRRQAVRIHATLNGIDYLEVLDQEAPAGSPRQRTLLLRCLKTLPASTDDNALTTGNVRIEGGVRIRPIHVLWAKRATDAEELFTNDLISEAERDFFLAQSETDRLLLVRTDLAGDFSTYRLCLVTALTKSAPPAKFDPILSCVDFSFKVACPSDFDCQAALTCPPQYMPPPSIDYLAKDYASFRRLLLDRLAVVMPDWKERNPADLGIALVELLAYAADYLSYYQDAVATEAYLGTARRRVSVRRHARLLDYRMHEGCNARVWVQFQVDTDVPLLERGTALLTRLAGQATRIAPNSTNYEQALAQQPVVFETMHSTAFFKAHNKLSFYTWGDEACCLPKGATCATLAGSLTDLKEGEVLIFEEVLDPHTGRPEDADPTHRHAVRLTKVRLSNDPLGGRFLDPATDDTVPVTEIEWRPEDALPFPLCISSVVEGETIEDISIARGNVLLVDHGRTIEEDLQQVPEDGRYRPRLLERGITYRLSYDDKQARSRAATEIMKQDSRVALPAMKLTEDGEVWTPQHDLLNSDRFATDFVVEMEDDGRAFLRFGDEVYGNRPAGGTNFKAIYRIGSGTVGNVGAEAIAHVVTNISGITRVRNPLPAQGGIDPESLEVVRLNAPQAFRTQERAVTAEDYAVITQRHPEVQKAVATRRWTGSWYTMFITVDRKAGQAVDAKFDEELRTFLERFRLAGQDVEIDAPRFVSLDIAFAVCVAPGYFRSDVKEALLETFSNRDLLDGRRGFFHPDNFTFDQPVYLSQVVAAVMQVPGVQWVDVDDTPPKLNRFRRWGETSRGELEKGMIEMGRLEIARLDNDPNAPENGKIEFYMEGGI